MKERIQNSSQLIKENVNVSTLFASHGLYINYDAPIHPPGHHIYINYDAPIHPPYIYIYINYDAALKHFLSKFYSKYAYLKLLISTSNKNITYILIMCNSDDLFG